LFASFEEGRRKGLGGEEKGKKGREKGGKTFPLFGVKETNKERRWRAYVIILLFYHFFSLKINTLCYTL